MTVSVDSPMTEQTRRQGIRSILADENPRAAVVTFRFSPLGGVAEVDAHPPWGHAARDRHRQDERRIGLHGEQADQGHCRRLRRLIKRRAVWPETKHRERPMAPAIKPRIRLDKKEAKVGDVVEVKALVSHLMETGLRKDASGQTVPRKILNKFTCTVNGKEVFAADFETAISANPYIQFKFRGAPKELARSPDPTVRRRWEYNRRRGILLKVT